jgi:bifunctional non-homologous end joining protein LigD
MDKYRLNRGQEFVIGGYIPGPHGFDSFIVGYYQNKDLIYVARVRNGFVPALRQQVFERIRGLVSSTAPLVNLPDEHPSRWGENLSAEKMKECVWLRPEAVAQIEFLEWTAAERPASDYTRSSSTTREVSDHASLSSALGPRV